MCSDDDDYDDDASTQEGYYKKRAGEMLKEKKQTGNVQVMGKWQKRKWMCTAKINK